MQRYAMPVVHAFLARRPAQSPCVPFMGGHGGRRLTTDGNDLLSYDWWPIAYYDGDRLYITLDRYQTGEWASGKAKFSPTTDGHIRAIAYAAYAAGYRVTEHTQARGQRQYQLYLRTVEEN